MLEQSGFREKLRRGTFAALRCVVQLAFRPGWVEHGQHHSRLPGGVYLVNFASWADGFLLAVLLEKEFREEHPDFAIAVNIRHKNRRWVKWLKKVAQVLYYDPVKGDAECNAELVLAIRQNRTVILQPEGRPTDSGNTLPVCDTLASMLAELNPPLNPLYIQGLKDSWFSAVKPRQFPLQLWPKVTLHLFLPKQLQVQESLKGRARTEVAARQLYDMLCEMDFSHQDYQHTLFSSLIDTARYQGGKHIVAEDAERNTLSYRQLLTGAFALGKAVRRQLGNDETRIGVMLPNTNATLITFCGLQAYGITTALLNFTAGRQTICAAAKVAHLQTVVTSRRFLKMAELEPIADALRQQGVTVLELEDLRKEILLPAKLSALIRARFPHRAYERIHRETNAAFDAEATAVILFTSGSEGAPKGVALSHANLVSNITQIRCRIDLGIRDCMFNALPIFHTSGLTGGYLLPLLSGMRMFLYPSPLHYQTIPELIGDTRATVLFATDTFLNGYARYARPHDLHRLRYVVAGAEKLREETRRLWAERFGTRVFEGYGVTETAPVLAFNTPLYHRPGTVGRLVPGIEYTLAPVEGIAEGGRLKVRGPNVMEGYILPENQGEVVSPAEGWHDTGDIVTVDEEGFITISGRARRFAKIGGEMVSFAAIETALAQLWPDADHAVISRPDPRKGEQLVLLTTFADASREAILAHFREAGITELSVPRQILAVESLPILGSGKTDYPAVAEYIEKTLV